MFYRILKSISYIDIPLDSGDFCLMSRRVVDILNQMPEASRYIRGMRTWIGFKQVGLPFIWQAQRTCNKSRQAKMTTADDLIFNILPSILTSTQFLIADRPKRPTASSGKLPDLAAKKN